MNAKQGWEQDAPPVVKEQDVTTANGVLDIVTTGGYIQTILKEETNVRRQTQAT